MQQAYSLQEIGTKFIYKVYGWTGIGLAITAVTAYAVSLSSLGMLVQKNGILLIALFVAQFGLVIALSAFSQRMSLATAIGSYVLYSAITGVSLSVLFLAYTGASLASTFLIASAMFSLFALYGYCTKADLTSIGSLALMGLIGMIGCMVVNMFLQSPTLNYVVSGFGVIIFSVLTAYDIQMIKRMSYQLVSDGHDTQKVAIIAALTLYLDYLNLFLTLLSFTGKRK
jgi:FtsH-binding integral membrane protein